MQTPTLHFTHVEGNYEVIVRTQDISEGALIILGEQILRSMRQESIANTQVRMNASSN